MTDCVRAPIAQKVGVKSGVCFPIIVDGEVVGTMDFFATETLHPSQQRLDALRNVGRLVSQAVERLAEGGRWPRGRRRHRGGQPGACRASARPTPSTRPMQTALDTVRGAFGWAYGSYWRSTRATTR